MVTPVIKHSVVTGAAANPSVLVDGPAWDAVHTITGLENVDNTSDVNKPVSTAQAAADAVVAANAANASNLTSGTVAVARLPTVDIPHGGTGQITASAAFDALSPTTTRGDLIARGASANQRLALGTSGLALMSNGTDPAWTGFLQSGTGAVTRTWQDKARDFVSVRDFGADPTGVADSATALNNALAALTGTGGLIYFPPGKYRFNSAISFNLPAGIFSVALVGAGQDNTILFWPSAAGGLTFNYAGINSSAHIRDMSFTTGVANGGNAVTLNMASSIANPANTAISDVYRVTMRGDDGYSVTDYWGNGLNIKNVSNVQVENLAIFGSSTQQGGGVSVIGLPASSTYGVQYNIAKSTFTNLAAGFIYGSFIQGVTIEQSNFNACVNGINAPAAQTGILAQLAVTNCQFGGFVAGSAIITATAVNQTLITNNTFILVVANTTAMFLQNNGHFTVTGNSITASTNTSTNGVIVGTTQAGSGGTITGNDIRGFDIGILLQAGSLNTNVQGNTLEGNTTNISNGGTSNVIANNTGYNPVGPAAITVGASPFTYTAGASPETIYIWGGTVSAVQFDKNGGGLGAVASNTVPCSVQLGPYEQVKVTYSSTPNMNKMIH